MNIDKRKIGIIEGNYASNTIEASMKNINYILDIIRGITNELKLSNVNIGYRMELLGSNNNSYYINLYDKINYYSDNINITDSCYTYCANIPNTNNTNSHNGNISISHNIEINVKFAYNINNDEKCSFDSYVVVGTTPHTMVMFMNKEQTNYFKDKIDEYNGFVFSKIEVSDFKIPKELEDALGITMNKNFEILDNI